MISYSSRKIRELFNVDECVAIVLYIVIYLYNGVLYILLTDIFKPQTA